MIKRRYQLTVKAKTESQDVFMVTAFTIQTWFEKIKTPEQIMALALEELADSGYNCTADDIEIKSFGKLK